MSIDQFQRWLIHASPELRNAAVTGMRKAGAFLDGQVVTEISRAEPRPAVNTGALRNSVETRIHPDGAIVGVSAPHAAFMEYGRRPGRMPPAQPIEDWVRQKFSLSSETEIKSLAFVIRRSIAQNGIAPRQFFAKAWDRSTDTMSTILTLEMAKTGWRAMPGTKSRFNSLMKQAKKSGRSRR